MFHILYSQRFVKKMKNFLKKHPDLKPRVKKSFQLLESNPQHPSLRLHKLKGKHSNIYSVSLNMAYRITLDLIIEDDVIKPIDIGSHDEVY